MGRHTAARIPRTLAAGASVLVLAPALVFSQGPPTGVNPWRPGSRHHREVRRDPSSLSGPTAAVCES